MDKSKERQEMLKEHFKNNWKLESKFDFSDCEDGNDVINAVCKMLIDNFDIGHEGSYIKELIQIACYEYAEIENLI